MRYSKYIDRKKWGTYIGGMTGDLLETIHDVFEEEHEIFASESEFVALFVEPRLVVNVRVVVRVVVVIRERFYRFKYNF